MGQSSDQIRGEIDQKRADAAEKIDQLQNQVQGTADDMRAQFERNEQVALVRSDIKKRKALEWLLEQVEVVDESGATIDRASLEVAEPDHDSRRLLLEVALERGLHRLHGNFLAPAGREHGLEHGFGGVAGLRLLDDPLAQLGRDLLAGGLGSAVHSCIFLRNTSRSGRDAAASKR